VAWDIILPKLLFYTKSHPPSYHFNPKSTKTVYFHTDTYLPTYLPPNEKRQERDIIKLQSLGNSEMQNMYMDLANTSVKVI